MIGPPAACTGTSPNPSALFTAAAPGWYRGGEKGPFASTSLSVFFTSSAWKPAWVILSAFVWPMPTMPPAAFTTITFTSAGLCAGVVGPPLPLPAVVGTVLLGRVLDETVDVVELVGPAPPASAEPK